MESVQLRLMDRISDLPDDVKITILNYLPTRDAVRTSILSRKWRHVKDNLTQFVLEETLWKNVAEEKDYATMLMKVLLQLFLGHEGPIKKFKLSYPEVGSFTAVDNLLCFISKRQIEDFSIEMYDHWCPEKDPYLLPLSILSCPTLRHLELKSCSIRSFTSVGSSILTTLKLVDVIISAETLARLISVFPLLGTLDIVSFEEFDICIDAPNLRSLTIEGGDTNSSIDFKRVPALTFVSIKLKNDGGFGIVTYADTDRGFFGCLLALETLELSYHVVDGIVGSGIPKKLPTSLINLKGFMLSEVSFSEMAELTFILCLLRSSPNLKYIELLLVDYEGCEREEGTEEYMEGEDFSDVCLRELSEVKLVLVSGTAEEFEFIRLLLAKSPSLKKIQIQPAGSVADKGFGILKEVSKFPRISNVAQLILG